ncbi:hypothetical protein BJ741DRAFT_672680 [Chytriomyces cf. hyalinus JEL632]|nr:hypothetical protein BJ741DRAFT_672680 [Chytriomyces cf. hyalinus JEL632]
MPGFVFMETGPVRTIRRPQEVLDCIALFVNGSDIRQLCHAIRCFKYISKTMFDFGHLFKVHNAPRPAKLWHSNDVQLVCNLVLKPTHLRAPGTYSSVLSKHGGYASVDDSAGMELSCLNMHVFFSAMFSANKTIIHLSLVQSTWNVATLTQPRSI